MVGGIQHTEKTDENTLKAEGAMLADALRVACSATLTGCRRLMCVHVAGPYVEL